MIACTEALGKGRTRRHGTVIFNRYIALINMHGKASAMGGRWMDEGRAGKRILVLSVPAGAGHTRAAEAIRASASAVPGIAEVIHLDATAYATPRLRQVYADLYIMLVRRAPAVWSWVYDYTNTAAPDGWAHRLRRRIEQRDCAPLLAKIAALRPDAIVCTHFLPAEILSREVADGMLRCPVWVQVTDFDLHRMWVHRHMAGYFAGNDEVAFLMEKHGIARDGIHVTGIPVMPTFTCRPDRAACARELGIDPGRMTFLLMGGGAGLGGLSTLAQRLLAIPGQFQLIALAGRNAAELTALQRLAAAYPGRLVPQGFTDKVERLMACADVAITKPGGATTAECLALGLPMIVNASIPGQEERNANFLLEHGAAMKAFDAPSLEYRVRYLMAHPAELDTMRARALALGRPHAAAAVLAAILKQTEPIDACV
ncbi:MULTISPECIES: glycosyltransferase [unclassified Massilia]|uniref:MGDG synthase family glycosyltransferase n=1 Tax=unclassified Massilia TaxID=2609279 RepID=UPI000AC5001C|nr:MULTISPECIES: glycosyltransferase [unclassified Massilia]